MKEIDRTLAEKGVPPPGRPLHAPLLLGEAFGWEGNILPPKELAKQPGYSGDILMAKVHEWYTQTYGDKLKLDFALGYAPYRLLNAIWRVRVGLMYGTERIFADRNLEIRGRTLGTTGPATFNALCAIEQLPKGLANRLTDDDIESYLNFCGLIFIFAWRDRLPKTNLLNMARADYDTSTSDLIAHRYGQSRWATQQAVEKTLKGLLELSGTEFPRGTSGHDLLLLGEILAKTLNIALEPELLKEAMCSARVRYGEEPSTETEAYRTNHAALRILDKLRTDKNVSALLTGRRCKQHDVRREK